MKVEFPGEYGKDFGCCYGVERSIELAEKALEESDKEDGIIAYSLGPLIHNPAEIERLQDEGIEPEEDFSKIISKDKPVIVRAHGTLPKYEKQLEDMDLLYVMGDGTGSGTCPRVKGVQKLAENYAKKGWKVGIVGESEHPEVIGIMAHCRTDNVNYGLVFEDPENIWKYCADGMIESKDKLFLGSQTTQPEEKFNQTVEECEKARVDGKFKEFKYMDTRCSATKDRQEATIKLAKEADKIIVVGGKNSSNTTRLRELSDKFSDENTDVYHIERTDEIEKGCFDEDDVVCITAGASTPKYQIKDVGKKLISEYEVENVEEILKQFN